MKCRKQPKFLTNRPIEISDIWEVRLSTQTWHKIQRIAAIRRSTLTSITRYCLFRMIEAGNLKFRRYLKECHKRTVIETKSSERLHRHMICFYGEDLVLVKLSAMRLNVTVSALVRIALHLFLPRLAAEIHSKRYVNEEHFYAYRIKRWMHIIPSALNIDRVPVIRSFAFATFPPWFWW